MNKKIIKNKNCILEIEGKEKFNLKIKDKEILNFNFYVENSSFISKEEAKKLLEFNKILIENFPEIKIYSENDFTVIKFLNYEIFFSEVVILTKLKNEIYNITFSENIEKIKEKDLPNLNHKFQPYDFTVSFGKYWVETNLDIKNPSFRYEIGCEEKFRFYLNQMSYKSLSSPKFKTFVRMIELSYKYINMKEFFKKYFSIK